MYSSKDSVLFGNGLNRLAPNSITWADLLTRMKGVRPFPNGDLPNTMIYERIVLERSLIDSEQEHVEFAVKTEIASALKAQPSHPIYDELVALNFDNYLTTNYDYAFQKKY